MVTVPNTPQLPEGFAILADSDPLALVNPDDFEFDRLFSTLGLVTDDDVFMTTDMFVSDPTEIKERQAVVKDIMANAGLREELANWVQKFSLPSRHDEFVAEYQLKQQRTSFWRHVKSLSDVLNKSDLTSQRLITLRDHIANQWELEETDQEMARIVGARINNMIIASGTVEVDLTFKEGHITSVGRPKNEPGHFNVYQRYGPATLKIARGSKYSPYRNSWWWEYMPKWFKVRFDKWFIRKNFTQVSVNDESVCYGLANQVGDLVEEIVGAAYIDDDDNHRSELDGEYSVQCTVVVDQIGPRLKILGVVAQKPYSWHGWKRLDDDDELNRINNELDILWPDSTRYHMNSAVRSAENWRSNMLKQIAATKLVEVLVEDSDELFRWHFFEPYWQSKKAWGISQHVTMKDLWNDPEILEASTAVQMFMDEINSATSHLRQLSDPLHKMTLFAKRHKLDLNLPEMVENDHIIAFEEMVPVQIYREPKEGEKPMTFTPTTNMIPLGGTTVTLTGEHGGGKTTICRMLAQVVCWCHSGLPVFGKGVQFSPRESIGLSLLKQDADKSTMQSAMQKLSLLLEAVKEVPPERLLLIIDEVGTGTSSDNGERLGRRILDELIGVKIDLLFATQITQVARYAETIGATCYKVDQHHRLTLGIGEPDLDRLMDEYGINEGFAALREAG